MEWPGKTQTDDDLSDYEDVIDYKRAKNNSLKYFTYTTYKRNI
jgi:hypothetical protein